MLIQQPEVVLDYNDVRLPEISVLSNGIPVDGVVEVEISKNSFLGADRFRLSVAVNASGYEIWTANAIEIDISLGLNGSWENFILGPVDRVSVEIESGLIHIDGRDLTARFLDARTQESFENQTASDIAMLLASRQGLTGNITPTTTFVGRNFDGDYSRTTLDQYSGATTDWDLLVKLAALEGFDVWVDRNVLNFCLPAPDLAPLLLTPADCRSLHLERSLNLSDGLQVVVKSWDCRAQTAVVQSAQSSGMTAAGRTYVVVKPNLSQLAAATLAGQILAQMSQNSRTIRFERPGTLSSRPRQTLVLANTGTDFDATYVVTSVETRLSYAHGFTETVEARIPPWTAF